MATVETLQAELAITQQRLALAEQHNTQLAESMDKVRSDTDAAFRDMRNRMEEAVRFAGMSRRDELNLVDIKTMQPSIFSGKASDSYKCWSKKVKAFCNARKDGFRQALEYCERETEKVDFETINAMNWAPADEANGRLYDLLVMLLADDALIIAENHPGQGFEAWRSLSKRYDPVGEQFMFDRMTSLLSRERCRDIGELPGAIEKWTRDLGLYEKKTGKTLEKEWRVPIIFQMIPVKYYSEVKARWQLNSEKDITKFSQELVVWANELRLDQPRAARGPAPMDLDAMAGDDYTQEQWEEWETYTRECQQAMDWVGKGKGKKFGKSGKGGKGKGGKGKCNWCYEEGHYKKDCKKFENWKKEKDAERKRQGLPPFKPRTRGQAGSLDVDKGDEERGQNYLGMLNDDLEFDCDTLNAAQNEEHTEIDPQKHVHVRGPDWEFEADLEEQAQRFWAKDVDKKKLKGEFRFKNARQVFPEIELEPTATSNSFQALSESENEMAVDMLGAEDDQVDESLNLVNAMPRNISGVRTPEPRRHHMAATPTSATSYTSFSSQESLAESMARERRELLEKISKQNAKGFTSTTPMPSKKSTSRSPSANSRSSSRSSRKVKEIKAPPGIEDSGLESFPDTVLKTKSVEIQTEVHLSHKVKTVTWFPTVDDLHPVYEPIQAPEDEDVEAAEDGDDYPESEDAETQAGDVNDVDDLEAVEVVAQDEGKAECVGPEASAVAKLAVAMLTALVCLARVISVLIHAHEEEPKEISPVIPDTNPGVSSKKKLGPGKARLRKGITVDSGAHHNVMPKRLVRKDNIRESEGSKRGMHYVAANKGKIPNEGETDFKFQTSEGSKESWTFQIAEVNKALGAVSDRVDNDFRVVFDKDSRTGRDASYMLDKKSKKAIKMTRLGNVWVVDAIVDVKDISEDFVRQG